MKQLNPANPALKLGTTIYLKTVVTPSQTSRLLKSVSENKKLSGRKSGGITKGKWKGMPMYSLTLEERKTCPTACEQWKTCYGNNMPWAHRLDHKSSDFIPALSREVSELAAKHPNGFVVRLHVLGDFYSVPYVNLWIKLKTKYPNMQIFGYTHRPKTSPIGDAIARLNKAGSWIRWSDTGGEMSANCPPKPEDIVCPEQTGKTESCLTCGLCWSVKLPIGFLTH